MNLLPYNFHNINKIEIKELLVKFRTKVTLLIKNKSYKRISINAPLNIY